MRNKLILLLISATFMFSGTALANKQKAYKPKAPLSGIGKTSKANGLPKTKIVSPYVRKNGKYVNPYARSK